MSKLIILVMACINLSISGEIKFYWLRKCRYQT